MESYELSIRSGPANTRLPPCRVCNEKASGLHYGVNTCEACKRFFCRIERTNPKLKCSKDQKCEARPGGRSRCSYCRYQKCLQVGMSIQGRKMGRYTSIQRTQNTLEVKGLLDAKIDAMMRESKASEIQDPDYGLGKMQLKCPFVTKDEDVTCDMEATIEQVCVASKLYSLIWKPFHRDKDIWDKEVEFCRNRREQKLAYGYVEPFGHFVGLDAYKSLGIDTANERKAMLVVSHHLENCIKKVIKFAKAIPGFKCLPLDDQANLVKCMYKKMQEMEPHIIYWLVRKKDYTKL